MSYQGPKGTYDVVPGDPTRVREPHERPELWAWAYDLARDFFRRYNYPEARLPIFEEADLFIRSVGEASDIVRKEMFLFRDKAGRELALRPEGTAGAVRAYVEHGLYKLAQPVKLWYFGPMFRHERQQKGRYRQHVQIGAEVLGSDDPMVDVEVISLLYELHKAAGVRDEIVYLNNLGDMQTRRDYAPVLGDFLHQHKADLDPDSVDRIGTNPLRAFDSKVQSTQAVLAEAPSIREFLSPDAAAHFETVKSGLNTLEIPYEVDDRLVRGLDYYTLTVFEAKSASLGAQDTVGGGGRYNRLVEELGGPETPGMGFGTGVERILLAADTPPEDASLDVFFVTLAEKARLPAIRFAAALRREGIACDLDYAGRSAKGQFKQADRSGARYAIVIGDEELNQGICKVRDMASGEERTIALASGPEALLQTLGV